MYIESVFFRNDNDHDYGYTRLNSLNFFNFSCDVYCFMVFLDCIKAFEAMPSQPPEVKGSGGEAFSFQII